MSYEEFRRRIDTARQILVGAVPSPAGQIDQITYALMYKFMNDIDDQSSALGGKRSYFAGDYAKYNWHELMKPGLEAHEQLELYRQAIQGMSKNPGLPPLFREIYQNAFLPFNSPSVLRLFLDEINKFTHGDSDDIGDAYEYLLSITGSQGDVGQFRTPRHIIKFIVEAINPTKSDAVLDPAVGTAGFLIAAYNHVKSQHDGKDEHGNTNDEKQLTADELEKLHHNYRGFDIDPTMVRTASVNLYLHGFTSPDIRNHDSLSSEDYWNDKYDVILANPPFMTPKGGIQPHKKFSITANRAEVLFVDYIASHLKPNGRAGVIVPEGIIFQSGKAYKELRKNLVENYLYAVVSLPAGVFQPYSGVKTSILLMDKQLAKERDDILFIKVENDGYTLGAQRRRDPLNDQLPQSLDFVKLYQANCHQDTPYSHVVSRESIIESGDYNLSGDRYRSSHLAINHVWPVLTLGEITDKITDGSHNPPRPTDTEQNYPMLSSKNIMDGKINFEDARYLSHEDFVREDKRTDVRPSDILLTIVGALGRSVVVPENQKRFTLQRSVAVLKPKPTMILPSYLKYLLDSEVVQAHIFNNAQGVAQKGIYLKQIAQIKIPLPPIEIQHKIVAELDSYQKIIEAAQTIVKTYRPTFEIDPEWEMKPLHDIVDVRDGTHDSPKYIADGYPLVTSKNLKNGKVDFSDANLISEVDLKNINKRSGVDDGDILMPMIGTIGGAVQVKKEREFAIKNVALLKPRGQQVEMAYICFIMNSALVNEKILSAATGGTQKFISLSLIRKLDVPLPPIETQREIVTQLEAEQKLVNANKELIEIYQQKIKSKLTEVWGE